MRFADTIKKSRILQNGIWLLGLQFFNTIIPILTLPYITRVLGTEGYGEFSLALNWILYLQVLVEYGFGYLGSREIAYDKSMIQKMYSRIITIRVLLALAAFGLMNLFYALSEWNRQYYYPMLILFCMVFGTAFQLTWLFQGMQDMKYITMVNAGGRLVSILLVFILVRDEGDICLYSFLYSSTYVLSAVWGTCIARKKYKLRIRFARLRDSVCLLKEGWELFVSQSMAKILSGFSITVLGWVATAHLVGVYSAVQKIPFVVLCLFQPVSQAMFPAVSKAFSSSYLSGMHRVKSIQRVILPVFLGIVLSLAVLREWVVGIVFGKDYVAYAGLLIPLCSALFFGIINNFLGIQILTASGHQGKYSKCIFFSALLTIILNVSMGKCWSVDGVAWAAFLSEVILTIMLMVSVKRIEKG